MLGVVSYFLIISIIFTTGEGIFTQHNPKLTMLSILLLIIIVVSYCVLIIRLSKKEENVKFIFVMMGLYFFFLFGTPYFQEYQLKISNYLKTPSIEAQQSIINSVGMNLKSNEVPYIIDSELSIERTREEVIRNVLIIKKVVEGKIKRSEVDTILNLVPNMELKLVFYSKIKNDFVSITIDEKKNIINCGPVDYCMRNE